MTFAIYFVDTFSTFAFEMLWGIIDSGERGVKGEERGNVPTVKREMSVVRCVMYLFR